jgi:hypothetical protein
MVFLNPTILLGLLAASIPIVLHFLNLRKIKKVEFSTLAFLKELQKSKIRKIKIKQLLLLLLRILIILFLVASFARPTLESTNLGGVASKAKTTAVFILDNSFSMSVVNKSGSYLNQAKEQIKKIIPSFESGDELFLILTSDISGKANMLKSAKELDAIGISNVTIPFVKSLKLAADILKESDNFNKEIFLFSDFQSSTFLEKDSTSLKLSIENVKFYISNFGGRSIPNYSIKNVSFNNQIFELGKEIEIATELKSDAKNRNEKLVSLFLNGKRVAQKNIPFATSETIFSNFQATIEKAGLIEVLAEIEEDQIELDNKFYSHLVVPANIKLLIISSLKNESKFLKAALSTSKSTTFNFKEVNPNEFSNINLDNYNTLVLIGSELYKHSKILKDFVSAGGTILLFPKSNVSLSNMNKLTRPLLLPRIKGIVKLDDDSSFNEFEKIDYEHPIFNGLFEKKQQEIESPRIRKYLKFDITNNGRRIISLQDNSSFLSEHTIGKGKILFFGIAPSLLWSNFPIKNIFAPLINRSVSYLNTTVNQNENIFAGDVFDVNVSKRKSVQIKVVKPDGSIELVNHGFKVGNYLKYRNSSNVGNYKFYSNEKLLDVKSVNVNPKESELEIIQMKNFVEQIKKGNNSVVKISSSENYLTEITTARYGSELWKIFLIVALLLALVEMFIARSAKKDLVELEN